MYYKLTDQEMKTYGNFQWELGEWYQIPEQNQGGELCSSSFFHCYNHPMLAVIFNPFHAKFDDPRLFEIEVSGDSKEDKGTKFGFTKMKLVKEIGLPVITLEQKVEFSIRCAMKVYKDEEWLEWANNWLNGKDRSSESAATAAVARTAAADSAAYAAYAAARAAVASVNAVAAASVTAYAAAYAAANAANAAKIDLTKIIESMV